MKQILVLSLSLLFFASCKKKDSEPSTTTSQNTSQSPTYVGQLNSALILSYNSGAFDTTYLFNGFFEKKVNNSPTFNRFDTISTGGYSANASNSYIGEVLSSSNFMQLASNCSFHVVSSDYGNFQFNDFRPIPKFAPASNTMPLTFDANQGLPININGISDADYVNISDDCDGMCQLSGSIKTYYISGSNNIVDTIKDNMLYYIPINSTIKMQITLGKGMDTIINGHKTYFNKTSTYNFPVKRTN